MASVAVNADQNRRAWGVWGGMCPPQKLELSLKCRPYLNDAIWSTVFHRVKHLTACLQGCLLYFWTGRSNKWRGHAPSLKSGGTPLPPGSATYVMFAKVFSFSWNLEVMCDLKLVEASVESDLLEEFPTRSFYKNTTKHEGKRSWIRAKFRAAIRNDTNKAPYESPVELEVLF